MAQIRTTGNHDIDTATAEIAVALRNSSFTVQRDQDYYDEAMRLRDAIMAGTRELDGKPFQFTHGSDEAASLREQADADRATDGSQDYLWHWLEHGDDAE
jgi:hypothetical protein